MAVEPGASVTTNIPQRLDRLPWSRWHWLVVTALGVTWLLDGLEVSIVAAVGPVLTHSTTLHLSESQVGLSASAYLTGSVLGALVFSYLTDRQGRKKWFMITLLLYLAATMATAFAWDLWSLMACRFLTGAGIGGEYAAINSAIDELIPARRRGHTDLAINGSWWLGAATGAVLSLVFLNPQVMPMWLGWRVCFLFGAVLGVGILLLRRVLPESPRWLMTHNRAQEAERVVSHIEARVASDRRVGRLPPPQGSITVRSIPGATIGTVARVLFRSYRRRTVLGIALMVTQSFMYNAVSFTFPFVLTKYYDVPFSTIGLYILPFALGNFLGPLLLGRWFDTIGRKPMISSTYGLAGVLLALTGYGFAQDWFDVTTHLVAWSCIFFFASAGASAAYLTVSEIFPVEIRAMAIAFFFMVAQGAGILAPWLYGRLVETSVASIALGYGIGAVLMLIGALAELVLGVNAEQRSLESDRHAALGSADGRRSADPRLTVRKGCRRPRQAIGRPPRDKRRRLACSLMKPTRLVIIGGVAGGASAAARARRLCESCVITVFERGPHASFANCGLPYFVGGEILQPDDLLVQTPASLRARFNLDVRVNSEVTGLDRTARLVTVRERHSGRLYQHPYDALILSTGAAPLRPPIPGIERDGHFMVRNIPDVERITDWIRECRACRAVVVGGGYIGLEMAEQLVRHGGLSVSIVEALPQVMAPLDPEMAAWLHQELRRHGVDLFLGSPVTAFEAPGHGESARASVVVLNDGRRLPADTVVLGLGVRSEARLAREAGLDIGALGGIRVNEYLQTTDPHIWAVGDAIEVRDAVTGAWSLIPLAGPANRQGRIAADNIFGRPARYHGTWGTAVLRVFDLTAGCTGANEKTLRHASIPYEALHLHPGSHAGYYPGSEPIAVKLLFAPDTGKLLGAQAVGRDGVDKRLDVFATALKGGMTVHDLADLELAYAPPYGSAKDPVNLAGMAAENVLDGDVALAQWDEVAGFDPANTTVLDVRRADEREKGFIPGSIHIPLDELRGRLGELPRDRELVVYCHTGQRSYFACRLLAQSGFQARNLTGSWRTWRTATGS